MNSDDIIESILGFDSIYRTPPDQLASFEQIADLLANACHLEDPRHFGSISINEGRDAKGRPFRITQDGTTGRGLIEWPSFAVRTGSTQSAANDDWH